MLITVVQGHVLYIWLAPVGLSAINGLSAWWAVASWRRAVGELRESNRLLSFQHRITTVFLTSPGEGMFGEVLQIVLEAVQSEYGVFGFVNEEGQLVTASMTGDIGAPSRMPDKRLVFPQECWRGIWTRAMREKKTILSNNLLSAPQGHIAVSRAMNTPIIYHGDVIGILSVANKSSDYTLKDRTLLEGIANAVAPVLRAWLQRDREEANRRQAQEHAQRVQEEAAELQKRETEAVRVELAKVREELALKARLAMMGQSMGGIVHELRNSLGAIRNAVYFLNVEKEAHVPLWDKYLQVIIGEVNGADRIIRDLLEMCRGKAAQKEAVDLRGAVKAAWQRSSQSPAVRCSVTCDPEPFIVGADWDQLVHVLSNMIVNAGEAMEGRGDILVAARRSEGYDEIVVRDTGPGVPSEQHQAVFVPLFTTKAKGTGFGLAVCRQIIEGHGGTLDLLEEGPGAAFRIRLPRTAESIAGS